jgi:hypothetical protein
MAKTCSSGANACCDSRVGLSFGILDTCSLRVRSRRRLPRRCLRSLLLQRRYTFGLTCEIVLRCRNLYSRAFMRSTAPVHGKLINERRQSANAGHLMFSNACLEVDARDRQERLENPPFNSEQKSPFPIPSLTHHAVHGTFIPNRSHSIL